MSNLAFAINIIAQGQPGPMDQLLGMLVPLGLIFIIFYFILWRPQAKRDQKHKEFLNALKAGDKVVTKGGILGKVTSIDDQTITLEISKGTKIRILRQQIHGSEDNILSDDDGDESADEEK